MRGEGFRDLLVLVAAAHSVELAVQHADAAVAAGRAHGGHRMPDIFNRFVTLDAIQMVLERHKTVQGLRTRSLWNAERRATGLSGRPVLVGERGSGGSVLVRESIPG